MKAIDSAAYLVCAGVLALGGFGSGQSTVNAQSAQSQSQTDNRARLLQSQPPKINTDQEWRNAVEFMKANCPNRINFMMAQLQNRPIQFERAKELILKQYRPIAAQKDPELRNVAIKQAQVRDQVFGAQIKFKEAKLSNNAAKELEARTAMERAQNDQVTVEIALRMLRMAKLQSEIDTFQKRRQDYVKNWSKDELAKATANNLDGSAHGAEDAIVDDNSTIPPPPAPPTKK
jgi:hypothetical protein